MLFFQALRGTGVKIGLLVSIFFSTSAYAQDCSKKIAHYENMDVQDIRPVLIELKQYVQQHGKSFTADCNRRISYLIASLYEANGNIDTAIPYFEKAVRTSLKCNSDTAIIETFLRAAGFFQRQYNLPRCKTLLDSATIYIKKYMTLTRQPADLDTRFAVYRYDSELTSTPDFKQLLKQLNHTQQYLLRLYHQTLGNYHIYNNEPTSARRRLLTAYHYAKNNTKDDTEANILNNLGFLVSNDGLYQKAATFFQEALLEYEKRQDLHSMPNTLTNLSYCFQKARDYQKAEDYALRAKEIAAENGLMLFFCRASIFQAKALLLANQASKAEAVIRESIDTAIKKKLETELAYNYRSLAEALLHQSLKWKEALKFATKSRGMTLAIGDSAYLPYVDRTLGQYYFKAKQYREAIKYTKQSIDLSFRFNDIADLDIAYKLLSDIYSDMGNYQQANAYLVKYEHLRDSLANREVQLSLQDLDKRYESQAKQFAIARLEQDQKEKEIALQHTRSRNRMIIALALVALSVAALLFYLYRKLAVQKASLIQTNRELEGMTTLQNRIFRIIGHDLKGMILPFDRAGKMMHYYLTRQDKQSALKYAGKMEENALRLTQTLNNLLYWGTGQLDGKELRKENLVLKEVLAELLESFNEVAQMKGIRLVDRVNPNEMVHADKGSLLIILRNLLSNAVKFTNEGSITVYSTRTEDSVTVHIQDDGVGMDEKEVQELLQLPLQKSRNGTQGEKGSGIGFSIVKKMAALHGAHISIKSNPGCTTVSVSFPLLVEV